MSRAFVKDDAEAPPLHRPRAPLPDGVRNYVTRRGLALLGRELDELLTELARRERASAAASELVALRGRIAELESRLASAEPVDSADGPPDIVRFGARVTIRNADGTERAYRIVGVDEANARDGRIAFVAPLARALLGKRLGESVTWKAPRGEEELEVLAIEFGDDST
jgi:transcription elongation factor GreB